MQVKAAWLGFLLCLCSQVPVISGSRAPSFRSLLEDILIVSKIGGVGVVTAQKGRYPYIVSLRRAFGEAHFCGGILVEEDLVLTAAHCVDQRSRRGEINPTVAIGVFHNRIQKEKNPEIRYTCRTIIHHKFTGDTKQGYDIALLVLNKNATKQPVYRLDAGSAQSRAGTEMTIIGWGKESSRGGFAPKLQSFDRIAYVESDKCTKAYGNKVEITDTMLCGKAEGADACEGDSGGPLLYTSIDNGVLKDTLMGLTSFGAKDCGGENTPPGVYVKISEFVTWITRRGTASDTVSESNAKQCVNFAARPEPIPTSEEILQSAAEGDGVSTSTLIMKAVAAGDVGIQELSRAIDVGIKGCDYGVLSKAVILAAEHGGKKVEKSLDSIILKLSRAPQKNCKPSGELTHISGPILKKIKGGAIVDAAADVRALTKQGEKGKAVLEEIVVRGIEAGMAHSLARVFVTAGAKNAAVARALSPFVEEIVIGITIAGLANDLIKNDVRKSVDEVLEVVKDKKEFPALATRQNIILEAVKMAVENSKKRTRPRTIKQIARVLVKASNSVSKVLEPSIRYITNGLDGV